MAVVVVNCPVRMMSLSDTAQNKVHGIQHDVHTILRASNPSPHEKNYDANVADGFYVYTRCGQRIDGYPETLQGSRPCGPCQKSKKPEAPTILVRLMPPIGSDTPILGSGGHSDAYWERYTEDGFTAYLMQRGEDDAQALREGTFPPTRIW